MECGIYRGMPVRLSFLQCGTFNKTFSEKNKSHMEKEVDIMNVFD